MKAIKLVIIIAGTTACFACSRPAPPPATDALAAQCDTARIKLSAQLDSSGQPPAPPIRRDGEADETYAARQTLYQKISAEIEALERAVARCEARQAQ